ncbi:MAG: hypothetical protein AAF380_02985, partial [Bacteroidota bacterium]
MLPVRCSQYRDRNISKAITFLKKVKDRQIKHLALSPAEKKLLQDIRKSKPDHFGDLLQGQSSPQIEQAIEVLYGKIKNHIDASWRQKIGNMLKFHKIKFLFVICILIIIRIIR